MIDAIRELRESIPPEQREEIAKVLAEEEMAALGAVLSSTKNPKKTEQALDRFKAMLKKNPIKAFKLWSALEERQRELVKGLIE